MKLLVPIAWFFVLGNVLLSRSDAQSDITIPSGFQVAEGEHLRLITDLPDGAEAQQLVRCFDAAMEHWGRIFDVAPQAMVDWKCTACVMLDRARFEASGLIPNDIPQFPYGFQYGDRLWVTEQPSSYYRRHLLLHEGTHWFMWRKYGGTGPPWLMEGMAEWLATHRWSDAERRLEMGIIPRDKQEVPYWGRIKILRDQLADGLAPSLEDILRYDNTAHRSVEAYAWSWAVVLFLSQHPDSRDAFRKMLHGPLQPDATNTRSLFRRLHAKWPILRAAWRIWINDLDYGADPSRMMLHLADCKPLQHPVSVSVDAAQGWQPTGVCVPGGVPIRIAAAGKFTLADLPRPWTSTADGVTLEYYRGRPLGQLIAAIVGPEPKEAAHTESIPTYAVGSGGTIQSPSAGQLILRINEPSGALDDNRGSLTVQIQAGNR